MKQKTWKPIEVMAKALSEYRGLDRDLIIELDETGDIITSTDLISSVLYGFLELPYEQQNQLLVAGVIKLSKESVD